MEAQGPGRAARRLGDCIGVRGLARAVGRGAEGRCLDKKKLGAGSYDMDLLHFSSSGGSMPVCRYRQVQDIRLI